MQSNRTYLLTSKWSQHLQETRVWLHSVKCGVLSIWSIILLTTTSAFWKHTWLLRFINCNTHTLKLWKTWIKLVSCCCKFWVYSLDMILFGLFWQNLWPKMVYKMSQEFSTASLDITDLGRERETEAEKALNERRRVAMQKHWVWSCSRILGWQKHCSQESLETKMLLTEIRECAKTVNISCNAWFRNAKQPRRSQEIKFCYMTSISPGWNRTAQHTTSTK